MLLVFHITDFGFIEQPNVLEKNSPYHIFKESTVVADPAYALT